MNKTICIQEANQSLTKKFLLSGEYPEVCGTAYDVSGNLILYLKETTQREFPKEYLGFPLKVGEFKLF